jgi:hypothetical protein
VIHDQELLDRLGAYAPLSFSDTAFRATRMNLSPLTPSLTGGRWAPKDFTPVLYTSTAYDGALAEISFHLALLTPRPSKPVHVHRIHATTTTTLHLLKADLIDLGVDWDLYGSLGYERCQQIGAAVAFLECDGLIAPSARWKCDNLMIFTNNHGSEQRLQVESTTEADWIRWAKEHDAWPDGPA